jgi:hypothetical protein
VPYIDLNDIMGPMWDAAVVEAEASRLLHHILSTALADSTAIPVYENKIKLGKVIRFVGSRSLYLRNGTELREFPDGHTFMTMGFEFGTETALMYTEKSFFLFGPSTIVC